MHVLEEGFIKNQKKQTDPIHKAKSKSDRQDIKTLANSYNRGETEKVVKLH